jgi:hypothetical protein
MGASETLVAVAPSWGLAIAFFIAMIAACELGFYWHRRWVMTTAGAHETNEESHVLAAALGLMALMLAFTFSMAQGRYETRRDLVVAEADALVASYLNAQLLDEPGRDGLTAALRHYADLRLQWFKFGGDAEKVAAYDRASEAMHLTLWQAMLDATRPHRNTTTMALVVRPLGELIALQEARQAAREAKVPIEVLRALGIYSMITAFMLGYVMGGIRVRHRIVSTMLFALVAVSVMVTLDLDSPAEGGIRLSGAPLFAAREVLNAPIPQK